MSGSSYRENDNGFQLEERVVKLEGRVSSLSSSLRANIWEAWRYLGYLLLLALVVVPMAFGFSKGCATGADARANAAREAVKYVQVTYPTYTSLRAYCDDEETESNSNMPGGNCHVTATTLIPDHTFVNIRLKCDDDPPALNDGCILVDAGLISPTRVSITPIPANPPR